MVGYGGCLFNWFVFRQNRSFIYVSMIPLPSGTPWHTHSVHVLPVAHGCHSRVFQYGAIVKKGWPERTTSALNTSSTPKFAGGFHLTFKQDPAMTPVLL